MLNLPESIAAACAPLFEAIPLEQAMQNLVGSHPKQTALVETILQSAALADRPDLVAGLWLYADNLERSHTVSQSLETKTGSYWHGIMHRREGDFSNSHYWLRRAAGHPVFAASPYFDSDALVDAVARAGGKATPELIELQRTEWKRLFEWCASNSGD